MVRRICETFMQRQAASTVSCIRCTINAHRHYSIGHVIYHFLTEWSGLEWSLLDGMGNTLQQFKVSIRVKVRVSVMVRVSIRTSWVVNFALFRCFRPVIYTRPVVCINIIFTSWCIDARNCLRPRTVHRFGYSGQNKAHCIAVVIIRQ